MLLFNHSSPSPFPIRSVRPTRRLNERKKEGGLKEERVELNNGIGRQIVPPFSSLNASASSPSYFDPELKKELVRSTESATEV